MRRNLPHVPWRSRRESTYRCCGCTVWRHEGVSNLGSDHAHGPSVGWNTSNSAEPADGAGSHACRLLPFRPLAQLPPWHCQALGGMQSGGNCRVKSFSSVEYGRQISGNDWCLRGFLQNQESCDVDHWNQQGHSQFPPIKCSSSGEMEQGFLQHHDDAVPWPLLHPVCQGQDGQSLASEHCYLPCMSIYFSRDTLQHSLGG